MNKFCLIVAFCLLSAHNISAQDWTQLIEGIQSKSANQVLTLPNGDLIIAGQVNDPGDLYLHSGLLVRTDTSGNLIWQRRVGSTTPDGAFIKNERFDDIALTTDGHLVTVGSRSPNQPNSYQISDVLVAKFDLDGNEIWRKYFDWGAEDNGFGVAALPNGEVVVCGNTNSFSSGNMDGFLLKLNTSGALEWRSSFGVDSSENWLYDVLLTSDQELLAVGSAQIFGAGNQVFAIKADLAGNEIWEKTFPDYALKGNAVVEHKNGHFGICGQSHDWVGATGFDNLIMEIDGAGTVIWDKRYYVTSTIAALDELFNLLPCAEGGYAAVGMSGETGFDGYYVLRVDAEGEKLLDNSYFDGAPYTEFASGLTWASDGGLVVTGGRVKPGGDYDLILSHHSGFGCTQPTATPTQEPVQVEVTVSPNPANDLILVEVGKVQTGPYAFRIYDASGKMILNTLSEQTQFKVYCQPLPSGTYFYTLQLGDGSSANGQLIIQR